MWLRFYGAKYSLLIRISKCNTVGLKHCVHPFFFFFFLFFFYLNSANIKNIDDYYSHKKCKKFITFEDFYIYTAVLIARSRKINNSLAFLTQYYLEVPKILCWMLHTILSRKFQTANLSSFKKIQLVIDQILTLITSNI